MYVADENTVQSNMFEFMLRDYVETPSQLVAGYRRAVEVAPTPLLEAAERSLIAGCGMGGSGFSLDAAGLAIEDYGVLLRPVRCHHLPPSITSRDPVIAVSYSGETIETIMCAREAAWRGSQLASISTGGSLHQLVSSRGGVSVIIDPVRSGAPRASLGAMTGAILGLVLGRTAQPLVERIATNLEDPGIMGLATRISEFLMNTWESVPVIVSCGRIGFLARRWRTELAENDMKIAVVEEYPEAGHNAINTWDKVDKHNYSFIILRGDPRDDLCEAITEYIMDMHTDAETILVDLSPYYMVHPLTAVLAGSMIVGISSIILASRLGFVTTDTSPLAVQEYKAEIRRRLDSRRKGAA